MKKIAFVCQRYGEQVDGGAEYYTKCMAEKLKQEYAVEVLTTKAISYETWDNYYPDDKEIINEIVVKRFPTVIRRKKIILKIIKKIIEIFKYNYLWLNKLWVNAQGPYSPGLIRYIKENKEEYDIFIFITYLYYPVVYGLPAVKDKAIFVPTAHDEYCIDYKIYNELFNMARSIVYLTEEEKKFVHTKFLNENIPYIVAGIGVDITAIVNEKKFRDEYNISENYFVYVGRVDIDKGCGEMFEYFKEYSTQNDDINLVVIGKKHMEIPNYNRIKYLGYVTEETKYSAIKGAKALWLPSSNESLSISVLEAFSLEVPVVVNGRCEVLKEHCEKSNAGLYYNNRNECIKVLSEMEEHNSKEWGKRGKHYLAEHYNWEDVLLKWDILLRKID